ncbi:MAG: hypothetical protein J7647_03625 [Cyanobacteria bacterium SBLK]|nr:hypothetical protein [Cyanobacteria bacterium SBLK]
MESRTERIPVQVSNDVTVMVETTILEQEQRVSLKTRPFEQVTQSVEAIAAAMVKTFETVQPDKAAIEFGLEMGLKEGKLIGLIVQNSTKANFKVTLEWEKS